VDHKTVKRAKPWFKCYDGNGHICGDFEPMFPHYADFKDWTTFEEFWPAFVEAWEPYGQVPKYIWVTLGEDTTVRYGIPFDVWMTGPIVAGGELLARQKMYYKKTRSNPIGCDLITEPICGVKIGGDNTA